MLVTLVVFISQKYIRETLSIFKRPSHDIFILAYFIFLQYLNAKCGDYMLFF